MGLGGLEKEIGIYQKGLLNSDYKGMEKTGIWYSLDCSAEVLTSGVSLDFRFYLS